MKMLFFLSIQKKFFMIRMYLCLCFISYSGHGAGIVSGDANIRQALVAALLCLTNEFC